MPTLSLAMIVKNEEAFLGHCLASVQGLVDEIVVVDTGSTDRTPEIAQQFGAKLHHFPWNDDFSAARNESLRHCTGDWVLILDADEAIDPVDHPQVRACLDSPTTAHTLVLRNYFLDASMTTLDRAATPNTDTRYEEGRQYSHYADAFGLRLFPRTPTTRFEGAVHESVHDSLVAQGIGTTACSAVIHHFGKTDKDREAFKVKYYLDLAIRDAQARPKDKQVIFNLVLQAFVAKDWARGLKAAQDYLRLSPKAPYLIHLVAATSLVSLSRPKEALPHLDGILASDPGHVMAMFQKGMAYAGMEKPKEGRDWLRKAVRAEPTFVPVYQFWAGWEARMGLMEEARRILLNGLEANPADLKLNQLLIQLSMDRNLPEQAVADAWSAIRRLPTGGEGHWHHLVAYSLFRQGQTPNARVVAEMGLKAFPDHPGLQELLERLSQSPP